MSAPLPHEVSGNKNSEEVLVFLHGWPDTTALWYDIIAPFETDFYILNISYPNFSEKEKKPKGIDFDELLDRIKLTIDQVNDTQRKIVVVGHDWGAQFAYWLDQRFPNYVVEIITLDVGLGSKLTPFIVSYQVFLSTAYKIGGPIGGILTRWMAKQFDYNPPHFDRIDGSWNYYYYYLWKRIGAGALGKKDQIPFLKTQPTCNIVYTWGAKKHTQFHGDRWIKSLAKNPKNEVHSVDSGHWITKEQPEFVINLIKRRLEYLKSGIYPRL